MATGMPDDPMCVQQTPHSRVPLHPPADDRGVTPGAADHKAAPQPAAHEPKLLVPGQAQDAKAAQKQAETASQTLMVAKLNLAKLVRENAPPAEISAAEHSADIAQEKAELATVQNAIIQREHKEQRSVILRQAEDELARSPQSSAATKRHAALDHIRKASDDVVESRRSFAYAEEMLHKVAGVPMRSDPSTDAATEHYPNLVIAQGKLYRAQDRLNLSQNKDVQQHRAQVREAAAELVTAWRVARADARKGSDPNLRGACEAGLSFAQDNFDAETHPK
jgi:hypothetical protein